MNSHELFVSPWTRGLVVIAHEGHEAQVEDFLESEIASMRTHVATHRGLTETAERLSMLFHAIFGIVDCLVAVVMALVIGPITQVTRARRLEESGLLNALGHSKRRLVRRSALETAIMTGIGWLVGLALAWLFFALLRATIYQPSGLPLGLTDLTPIWFSLPIPLVTTAVVMWGTARTFKRFDAVAIVERGKLSMEGADQQETVKRRRAPRSSTKPLSSLTFYPRHRGRGMILIAAMALMILGVSFPAFLFAPMADTMQTFVKPLRQIGVVTPRAGIAVDPGVAAQIRIHPTVAHVIPALNLPLEVQMPPLDWPISIYGLSQDDMQALMPLYELQLKEGRLPQPRTSEIAISEAVAQNRRLHVGDMIGQPVNEQDGAIRTEMVISGILSYLSHAQGEDDPWLGFAWYEYLTSHELYAQHPVHLLVVPHEGQKAEMDAWLRQDLHSDLVEVRTFDWLRRMFPLLGLLLLGVFGVVESLIAVVAAVAMAVLSYVFFVQRRDEFGILHAIGRSQPWLVMRTVGETVSVVTLAWLIGAAMCGAGLAYMQTALYAPRGLALDFLNPTPWLFTLPMPLAVVVVSGGLVARMLSRLDPVSVIERR